MGGGPVFVSRSSPLIPCASALSCPSITYMTSTSTRLAPVFTHTPACDVNALGAAASITRGILADDAGTSYVEYVPGTRDPVAELSGLRMLDYLSGIAAGLQARQRGWTCECRDLAFRRVTDRIRRARLALRAWDASENPDEVRRAALRRHLCDLTAERDAIRAAV